MYLYVKPK